MHQCKLAALFIIPVLALSACSKTEPEAKQGTPPPAVALPVSGTAIATAQSRIVRPKFTQPSLVEAVQTANLRADVPANLAANHFSPGQLVKQGDLLVELDPSQYKAAYDAANAELLSAKASLEQVEANWKRAEQLGPDGYISDVDFDKAKANVGMAQAALAKAEAGLERASLNLEHTRIRAPFDGRISKSNFAVGDYVTPLAGPLFELVQLDPIYVITKVPIHTYNDFVLLRSELQARGIELPELELSIELAGGREYPHKGKFENWAHASADSSGMIAGRALFPNPEGLLLPGQNLMLVGRAARELKRVMIPQKAVLQDQQGKYVYALDSSNTVVRKNIEVGIRDGADWAVRSGLEEGERIVIEGIQALRPGAVLNISDS